MNTKKSFNECLDELEWLYKINPEITQKETEELIKKLNKINNSKKDILEDINTDILCLCLLGITTAIFGLFNIEKFPIYIFGLVFFIAGLGVGATIEKFGLIFLFSHGVTGMSIMLGSQISSLLASPIMSDNPTKIYIYLGIVITLLLIATITMILYNLSHNLKKIKHFILVPIIIYVLAFFMSGMLPKIITLLY